MIVRCCDTMKKISLTDAIDKNNRIISIEYSKLVYVKNFLHLLVSFLKRRKKKAPTNKYYFWKDKFLKCFYRNDCDNGLIKSISLKEIFDASDLQNISFITNHENIAAAIVVSIELGINDCVYKKVITNFKGLPHRYEKIDSKIGIDFINDSKATNLDSTIKSICNIERDIVLILGGVSKGEDFSILERYSYKIKKIYVIGKDRFDIAEQIIGIPIFICETIDEVFQKIKLDVGDTLLFAPACASFDQFKNFEERGEKFKEFAHKYIQIFN